ncbi:MAG: hypothetical protein AB1716_06205 [Planctomycetota bacterium]
MRRKLIWAAVIIPASFYLLAFGGAGLPAWDGPPPGASAELGQRVHYALKVELPGVQTQVSCAISILLAMAYGLGVINLFSVHGATLLRKRAGRGLSLIVFISFAVVFAGMLWQYRMDAQRRALQNDTEDAWRKLVAAQRIESVTGRDAALAALTAEDWAAIRRRSALDAYRFEPREFYLNHMKVPLEATVMSLLGFYLTYAAYRAFRIRSLEATVMMLSAAVVILGSDAFGGWLSDGVLTRAAEFTNGVLNSGMQRGLLLGIGVATIAASLRILLGLERGVLEQQRS